MREKIGTHCEVISGYAFKTNDWQTEGIPVIKIGNISNGGDVIIDNSTQYVNDSFLSTLNSKYVVKKGDVLISLTGSHINQPTSMVGRTCRNLSNNVYLLNQRAGKVIPFANTEKQYLYYLLSIKAIKYDIANRAYGGANQVNVSPTDIKNIKWDFPSKVIQSTIANILSKYDELIEVNNQRIKKLEQTAEELYKEWFVRFRFPNYQNTEFESGIPKGWSKCKLGDIIEFQNGFAFKSDDFKNGGKYKIITIKNVQQDGFVSERTDSVDFIPNRMPNYCKLNDGDVLMSLTGNVGRVCIVHGQNFLLNQRVAKIKSDYPSYVYYMLRNEIVFCTLNNIAYGTAQLNLSPILASRLKIIVPSKQNLRDFEAKVSPIIKKIITLSYANDNLIKQRDLLLPRLMSGKLEV